MALLEPSCLLHDSLNGTLHKSTEATQHHQVVAYEHLRQASQAQAHDSFLNLYIHVYIISFCTNPLPHVYILKVRNSLSAQTPTCYPLLSSVRKRRKGVENPILPETTNNKPQTRLCNI